MLVVDDNRVNRLLLTRALEQNGHQVANAENGRIAMELLRSKPFDLLLLDIDMPEMNGFELYKEMYCIDPEVIFCFITAFEIRLSEFKKIFPTTKVAGFLKEPISANELARLLEEELDYAASAH